MRRLKWLGGMGIAAVMCVSTAPAGWNEFWGRMKLDYHRNAAYPEPFATADRHLVRQYMEITEANGWKLQNTLGDFLFERDTNVLNQAGQIRVKWILTSAPEHRRSIFVLRADQPQLTANRVASVQEYAASLSLDGRVPDICVTEHDVTGIPGQYLENIDKAYWSSIPVPRLPAATGGSSSGSSGSSGGGS